MASNNNTLFSDNTDFIENTHFIENTGFTQSTDFKWFALYVRSKFERTVAQHLEQKGFESYVPCRTEERGWADRIKVKQLPLFPNYVFCRFDPRNRMPVLVAPEVYSIVGTGKMPEPIPDAQIRAVKRIAASIRDVEAVSGMRPGQQVVVKLGPLTGLEGTIVRLRDAFRLVVMIPLLGRGVAVEIDPAAVRSVRT